MTRGLLCLALVSLLACSDDAGPRHEAGAPDGPTQTDDATLPWPDLPARIDTTPWKCTPTQPNMCDGYKTQYCNGGTCAACPPSYVDCDRQGDCECMGACDGTKCVKGSG